LESFHQDPTHNANGRSDGPTPIARESDGSPADFAQPQRNPADQQDKWSLAERDEVPPVSDEDQDNDREFA